MPRDAFTRFFPAPTDASANVTPATATPISTTPLHVTPVASPVRRGRFAITKIEVKESAAAPPVGPHPEAEGGETGTDERAAPLAPKEKGNSVVRSFSLDLFVACLTTTTRLGFPFFGR